jgi:hypothetical protein
MDKLRFEPVESGRSAKAVVNHQHSTTFTGETMRHCDNCGSPSQTNLCQSCIEINNHPEVLRNEMDYATSLAIEIDALEQAPDRTLFRKTRDGMYTMIRQKNAKLKNRD